MPKTTRVVTEGCGSYLEQDLSGQNIEHSRKIIAAIEAQQIGLNSRVYSDKKNYWPLLENSRVINSLF